MGGRRAILGKQNDGTMGLRVSAHGTDAFIGDGQGGDFTFNSAWTDITKLHQIGIGTTSLVDGFYAIRVPFPSLGYKPLVEVRKLEANLVRDDYWDSSLTSGVFALVDTTSLSFGGTSVTPSALTALYAVYKIPVPSG